eukprot:jgi/Picre1/32069/NNA_007417.t1
MTTKEEVLDRLKVFFEENNLTFEPGWDVDIKLRKGGNSAGTSDVYYFSPSGKRFRSRTEIAREFGIQVGRTKNTQKEDAAARDVKVVQFGSPSKEFSTEDNLVLLNYRSRWADAQSKVVFESRVRGGRWEEPIVYNVYASITNDEGKKLRYPLAKGSSPDDVWKKGQDGVEDTRYKYVNERHGWVQQQMRLRELLSKRGQKLRLKPRSKPSGESKVNDRVVERLVETMVKKSGSSNGAADDVLRKKDKALRLIFEALFHTTSESGGKFVDVCFDGQDAALEARHGIPIDFALIAAKVECMVYQLETDWLNSFASDLFYAWKMLRTALQRESNTFGSDKVVGRKQDVLNNILIYLRDIVDYANTHDLDQVLAKLESDNSATDNDTAEIIPCNISPSNHHCFICWLSQDQEYSKRACLVVSMRMVTV